MAAGPGDSAESLAQREHVPLEDIVELNDVADPRAPLPPGTRLFVPEPALPAAPVGLRFAWPLDGGVGVISSGFGARDGRPHEGVDIAAPQGTLVRAAAEGEVVYAGNGIRGYGNVVIVRHEEGFLTVYAHNLQNRVRQGERVVRGQVVALVGHTGNATAPHLHFEVRYRDSPRNPTTYLEKPR